MATNDEFYLKRGQYAGSYGGRTLIQAHGKIGGHRAVFVNIVGNGKNAFTYPPFGGVLANPFKGYAKMYAGDLMEYTPTNATDGATVKLLKYYELAKDVKASDPSILLVRDGYHHIPFIGDNIMIAPKTLKGTGTGYLITDVEATTEGSADVWKVTLGAVFDGTAKKGDILVEAAKAGASVTAMVTNPNCYVDRDNDFFYEPNASRGEADPYGAEYSFTPALANEDTVLNLLKCNTLPPAVLALNKSLVPGWFHL